MSASRVVRSPGPPVREEQALFVVTLVEQVVTPGCLVVGYSVDRRISAANERVASAEQSPLRSTATCVSAA
jgi:hypothetical protein